MSDFFEHKYQRPVFSPVIKITKNHEMPTFVSDIGLLSDKNMFDEAENVKRLMKNDGLTLMKTAQRLGIEACQVANKLRLLEFTKEERKALISHGYSEKEAICFLQLARKTRMYAMEYCRQEGYDTAEIEMYVKNASVGDNRKRKSTCEVNNIGFLVNSLNKTLALAEKMGFEVHLERCEDEEYHLINIRVRKNRADR